MDEHQEAEFDHIPRGRVFVPHQIESHRDVRVAVVAAQIML